VFSSNIYLTSVLIYTNYKTSCVQKHVYTSKIICRLLNLYMLIEHNKWFIQIIFNILYMYMPFTVLKFYEYREFYA